MNIADLYSMISTLNALEMLIHELASCGQNLADLSDSNLNWTIANVEENYFYLFIVVMRVL